MNRPLSKIELAIINTTDSYRQIAKNFGVSGGRVEFIAARLRSKGQEFYNRPKGRPPKKEK